MAKVPVRFQKVLSRSALSLFLVGLSVLIPNHLRADGEDNPTGVGGVYNGNVTDGGSWDPLTGNEMRVVDDIVVPGSVGAYPLKWTRYLNSRLSEGSWLFSYRDYQLGAIPPSGWSSGGFSFPDGRS